MLAGVFRATQPGECAGAPGISLPSSASSPVACIAIDNPHSCLLPSEYNNNCPFPLCLKETRMSQPLSGIRILDLSRLLPGAYASQMLADFGADVIKIEEPGRGDYGRLMPPYETGGMSLYFLAMNRNKRSMTLNLKSADGREIFLRLVRQADVVLESFRPGVME